MNSIEKITVEIYADWIIKEKEWSLKNIRKINFSPLMQACLWKLSFYLICCLLSDIFSADGEGFTREYKGVTGLEGLRGLDSWILLL
jgi:hypothetical protein